MNWTLAQLWARSWRKDFGRVRIGEWEVCGFDTKSLYHLYREIFVQEQYAFRARNSHPVIMDCGANIGMASLYFKQLYPEATIYAFEPSLEAYALLELNVASNGIPGIMGRRAALVGDSAETVTFHSGGLGGLTSSLLPTRAGTVREEVPALRLSDVLMEIGPDVVKMDIEGAEFEVLEDCADLLDYSDQWIIECHHKIAGARGRLATILALFERQGFDYNLWSPHGRSGDFQDVRLHFFWPGTYQMQRAVGGRGGAVGKLIERL